MNSSDQTEAMKQCLTIRNFLFIVKGLKFQCVYNKQLLLHDKYFQYLSIFFAFKGEALDEKLSVIAGAVFISL